MPETNPETGVDSGPYESLNAAAEGILALSQREEAPSEEPEAEAVPEPEAEQPEAEAEAEPESEAETPESEEAEPEGEPEEPKRFTVKVDGTEQEVTLDELLNGYQRTADYTRKTQEIATQRREAEADRQRIAQERQHYAQQLESFATLLNAQQVPTDDQIREAFDSDPAAASRMLFERQQHLQRMAGLQQEQARIAQQFDQERQQATRQALEEGQRRLPDLIPEWKDGKTAKAEKQALAGYMEQAGYTPQELAQLSDPRAVALVRKAWKFDQLQQSKPAVTKKAETAPRLETPGASAGKKAQETERMRALETNLRKTGKTEDAAALLLARMKGQ